MAAPVEVAADDGTVPPVFSLLTAEELAAIDAVTVALRDAGVPAHHLARREVALVTVLCKGRVPKAVQKYKEFLDVLALFDIAFDSLHLDGDHALTVRRWRLVGSDGPWSIDSPHPPAV